MKVLIQIAAGLIAPQLPDDAGLFKQQQVVDIDGQLYLLADYIGSLEITSNYDVETYEQSLIESDPEPQPEPPNTFLHKAWFKERLLPFAEDIKAARQADATVDLYFSILDEYKGVDVSWPKTIAMLTDAETRVKAIVPDSTISAADLLLPQQPHEVFYEEQN